jgi:hypothetical protein
MLVVVVIVVLAIVVSGSVRPASAGRRTGVLT